ncbi:MAG: sigma-E factor negative regulatory protein [Gammaproteobacteria bacterium]|nr:sigma-E factor negative regulatory protein [Gammaproteobacteria bacterium]
MNERISELIDNELDSRACDTLLKKLAGKKAGTRKWRQYHLIGNVIRGEAGAGGVDLSKKIMAQLDKEPTILIPVRKNSILARVRLDRFKTTGAVAVAASLVLVAVISFQPGAENRPRTATLTQAVMDPALIQEFNEMLVGHGEFTASWGLNGLASHAKFVGNQALMTEIAQ